MGSEMCIRDRLKYFLETLGEATFIEKLKTEKGVYALRFATEQGDVLMSWANGKTAPVTWRTEGALVRDVFGQELGQELGSQEVNDAPCYFFFSTSRES